MKTKIVITLIVFILAILLSQAQVKIRVVNFQELIETMSEHESSMKDLQALVDGHMKNDGAMMKEDKDQMNNYNKMKTNDLKPEGVWKYFYEITKIPRASKKEEKIIDYLILFGESLGLETKRDDIGNVLITKPAAPGYESCPTIVLQSHVDMVAEKNAQTQHDFDNDPIKTFIDGEWIKAEGTTLGADNGIGVAAQLAVLAAQDIEHGKIECLFTVDEENGLTGASAIQPGFFTGRILLNLDSEDEGELFIGCAGGGNITATFDYRQVPAPDDSFFFRINVTGLNGGHSGTDIHLGRANANKILTRFLWQAMQKYNLSLCEISGGNLRNAIPREASAIAAIPFSDKENIRVDLNIFLQQIEEEFAGVEPDIAILLESENRQSFVIDNETAKNLLYGMYACPNGVISMSKKMPGIVETSCNMANIKMPGDNKIIVGTSQRSSLESAKKDIMQMVESVFVLANASIAYEDGYPGWAPNPDSKILAIAKEAYQRLFEQEPKITVIHAGLECGLFLSKYPDLEMISFGPTIKNAHSPGEKMHIPSVEKFWNFLLEILKTKL